ncbi:MAG: hypothetical protein ACYC0Y_18755 [Pirellulales bacterium]
MKKSAIVFVCVGICLSLLAAQLFARGGGGRGGGGGFSGGARGFSGGGFSGGTRGFSGAGGFSAAPRPSISPSINRSPSMSRLPATAGDWSAARPGGTAGRLPSGSGLGQIQRAPGTVYPSTLPSGRAGAGPKPTRDELSNFLNLPGGAGRAATGGRFGETITGPGGGKATIGGAGGTRTGPGGTTIGAGRAGIKVTGPGGNTYAKVAGGAAIRGPGGNVVAAGRGASFVNGQFVGGRTWAGVNRAYNRWGYFTPGWHGRYPGAWWPGRWAVVATAWAVPTWAVVGPYCGYGESGTYYDYGQNVTYVDNTVYYGDQPVASAEQYYDQAGQIADSGATAQDEEWLPLGVFAVVADPAQTQTDKVVQLAINKEGVIRGNFQDFLADKVTPVIGAVDKKTQRVALRAEGNDSVVVETGLYNLTNDEVPVLVHFGPDRQEQRTLVRLKQPEGQEQQPQGAQEAQEQ